MTSMIRCAHKRLSAAVAMTAALMLVSTDGTKADTGNSLDVLLGSWRGGGQMELSEGKTERLKCNAYYTGGGSRLGVAIRCQSEISNIEFRSKLSQSGGRITGTWEERTYNAEGTASGQVTNGNINLAISGGVTGSMLVSFGASRQSVSNLDTRNRAQRRVDRSHPKLARLSQFSAWIFGYSGCYSRRRCNRAIEVSVVMG